MICYCHNSKREEARQSFYFLIVTISKNVGWHLESSTLSLVNGWRNEKKIGPKKHFREALEENVSDICTQKKSELIPPNLKECVLLTGGVGNNKKGCFSVYSLVEENDGWRRKPTGFQSFNLLYDWKPCVSSIVGTVCFKFFLSRVLFTKKKDYMQKFKAKIPASTL